MQTTYEGSCLCGKVHYQLDAQALTSRVCRCADCQKIASNGSVNAIFPTESLSIQGDVAHFDSQADSGNTIRRRFCPHCGSHLFSNSSARPHLTVVRVGTLSDPSKIRPVMNIWAISAPQWACLDPQLDSVAKRPA